MKLWTCFSPVCISLLLLAGCAAETAEETPGQAAAPEEAAARLEARIADGAETGELLLAGEDGRLYALSVRETPVTLDGSEAAGTDLRDGMRVTVCHSGSIQEPIPPGLGQSPLSRPRAEGRKTGVGSISGCWRTCGTQTAASTTASPRWGWICPR